MENQYSYYNPDDHQQNDQNEYQNQGGNQGWHHGHEPREPKEKKKMPRAVAVVGLALLFGVVSSSVFLTSNLVGSKVLGLEKNTESKETASKVSGTTLTKSSSVVTSDVSGVVENVMPSVVSITNLSVQEVQNFFGGVSQQESESAGSGIIISQTDEELLIVTNYHVIAGSETLTVTFDDETSLEANIKGTDSEHDLAVIAVPLDTISSDTMEAIAVATLGDSTKLQIGEPAIVIGNALGYGQSVTTGVISAKPTEQRDRCTDRRRSDKRYQADPDRCGDQPGQQRRRAGQCKRRSCRYQFLQDRRHDGGGNGLCDPDQ